jgi:hypothetical protein
MRYKRSFKYNACPVYLHLGDFVMIQLLDVKYEDKGHSKLITYDKMDYGLPVPLPSDETCYHWRDVLNPSLVPTPR